VAEETTADYDDVPLRNYSLTHSPYAINSNFIFKFWII